MALELRASLVGVNNGRSFGLPAGEGVEAAQVVSLPPTLPASVVKHVPYVGLVKALTAIDMDPAVIDKLIELASKL